MATTESIFGIGFAIGPGVGSLFYSIGGFGLPFWLVGGIALVASVLIFIFVPNVEASQDESSKGSKSLRLLSIAKSPTLLLPLFDNCIAFCGSGVFNLCGPYLIANVAFNQTEVGNTFMISGVAYIFTTFTVGMSVNFHLSFMRSTKLFS